jgi:hypothetical protein
MMPILSATKKGICEQRKAASLEKFLEKGSVLNGLREELASPYRRASLLRHGKRVDSACLRGVPPFAVNTSMKMGM